MKRATAAMVRDTLKLSEKLFNFHDVNLWWPRWRSALLEELWALVQNKRNASHPQNHS